MENSAHRGNEKGSSTAMLVRTSFRLVMEKLFFGNDEVLLGVEVDDDLVLKGQLRPIRGVLGPERSGFPTRSNAWRGGICHRHEASWPPESHGRFPRRGDRAMPSSGARSS